MCTVTTQHWSISKYRVNTTSQWNNLYHRKSFKKIVFSLYSSLLSIRYFELGCKLPSSKYIYRIERSHCTVEHMSGHSVGVTIVPSKHASKRRIQIPANEMLLFVNLWRNKRPAYPTCRRLVISFTRAHWHVRFFLDVVPTPAVFTEAFSFRSNGYVYRVKCTANHGKTNMAFLPRKTGWLYLITFS